MAASILPRWRTMPASATSRSTSAGPNAGHRLGIEAGEGPPEALPLAEDRQPRQPGLEALEADLLVEPHVVDHRAAPLVVVVRLVVRRRNAPPAAGPAVVARDDADLGPVGHRPSGQQAAGSGTSSWSWSAARWWWSARPGGGRGATVVAVGLVDVVVAPRPWSWSPPAAPLWRWRRATQPASVAEETRKVTSTGLETTSRLAWLAGMTSGASPGRTKAARVASTSLPNSARSLVQMAVT